MRLQTRRNYGKMDSWDMNIKIVRTFHPVGQGAFYSERFQIWKPEVETHNIVYDCGVCYMKEKQAVHVVIRLLQVKMRLIICLSPILIMTMCRWLMLYCPG